MDPDPWSSFKFDTSSTDLKKNFEDDFVQKEEGIESLPDSKEYLANLERKLQKIKKGSGETKKEILNSIQEKRRDCMVRLLAEEFTNTQDDPIDENIPTKWLKSHINPQQPLTVGELVELVKEDYLAKSCEESTEGSE